MSKRLATFDGWLDLLLRMQQNRNHAFVFLSVCLSGKGNLSSSYTLQPKQIFTVFQIFIANRAKETAKGRFRGLSDTTLSWFLRV
jgi:hypothetical protein